MKIRAMKPSDLGAIARVNVDTFTRTQRGIVPDSIIDGLTYAGAEERFRRMLSSTRTSTEVFVAEADGHVIGYAMTGLARERVRQYEGELYGIYILPEYHGRGIGRRLMTEAASHLRQQGLTSLFVVVFGQNTAARRFYETLGGQWIHNRTIEIKGEQVTETIYGWDNLDKIGPANYQ